jgi:hypothetical protein
MTCAQTNSAFQDDIPRALRRSLKSWLTEAARVIQTSHRLFARRASETLKLRLERTPTSALTAEVGLFWLKPGP